MLVTPTIHNFFGMFNNTSIIQIHQEGVYIVDGFNFDNLIYNKKPDEFYEDGLESYGVCDNLEQVLKKYDKYINDDKRKFCIALAMVTQVEQPPEKGWRWDRWGEYIGDKEPKHEYLYDEDDSFTVIYSYDVIELED